MTEFVSQQHAVTIPPPLIEQLKIGGRLIAPVIRGGVQEIVLLEKGEEGVTRNIIHGLPYDVPYVPLSGTHETDNGMGDNKGRNQD